MERENLELENSVNDNTPYGDIGKFCKPKWMNEWIMCVSTCVHARMHAHKHTHIIHTGKYV